MTHDVHQFLLNDKNVTRPLLIAFSSLSTAIAATDRLSYYTTAMGPISVAKMDDRRPQDAQYVENDYIVNR